MAFSAAAIRPVTRTGHRRRPAPPSPRARRPAGDVALHVHHRLAGLIERPPVSKVMPLPTSTTRGPPRPPPRDVVERSSRRRRRPLADPDDPPKPRGQQPPRPRPSTSVRTRARPPRPGPPATRVLYVRRTARIRARQPRRRPRSRRRGRAHVVWAGRPAPPARPDVLGGRERQWSESPASRRPRTPRGRRRGDRRDRGGDAGPVTGRPGQGRPRPAQVGRPLLADADQAHPAQGLGVRAAERDGTT